MLGALDVVNSANEKWLSGEEGVHEEEEEGAGEGVEAENFGGAHDVFFCCLLLLILHENYTYVLSLSCAVTVRARFSLFGTFGSFVELELLIGRKRREGGGGGMKEKLELLSCSSLFYDQERNK